MSFLLVKQVFESTARLPHNGTVQQAVDIPTVDTQVSAVSGKPQHACDYGRGGDIDVLTCCTQVAYTEQECNYPEIHNVNK